MGKKSFTCWEAEEINGHILFKRLPDIIMGSRIYSSVTKKKEAVFFCPIISYWFNLTFLYPRPMWCDGKRNMHYFTRCMFCKILFCDYGIQLRNDYAIVGDMFFNFLDHFILTANYPT